MSVKFTFRERRILKLQSHYLQLACARLDAGFTGGDLLSEGIFGYEAVRLAHVALIYVSVLVGFYKYVCNVSITPGKWGNVCCLLCGKIPSLVSQS